MPKLSPVRAKILTKTLNKFGFKEVRQKGGHVFLAHPNGRTTVVPVHPTKEVGKGLLCPILHECQISPEDYYKNR